MTARRWWSVWLLLALLAPLAQAATVRAFLDRSHVSLGDTVTLNIQSNAGIGEPDLSKMQLQLQRDFQVLGSSRSNNVSIVNGKTTSTTQLGIALRPLHAGTLTIPALDVGGVVTQPLSLHVGAAPSGGNGKVGDPVFMQTSVQSSSPYVGQQTIYTVRLFYLPGVNGALGDPSADGARLIRLDRDHRYVTERDGYAYKVIERSWALLPQRAGAISVQGPVFEGQGPGTGFVNPLLRDPSVLLNNPNALLNAPLQGIGGAVRATAPVVQIDARAAPANAGKPWLPARDVRLELTGLPADGKLAAGTPLTLTLSISAAGQPADALPEPELPPIAGARVYPDQTRDATDDSGQWLQGTRTRSFAIVPDRNGTLTIPAITLNWWDVSRDAAEQASVPAHVLAVSGVTANPIVQAAPPAAASVGGGAVQVAPATSTTRIHGAGAATTSATWRSMALASLVLWLLAAIAAAWWWLRGRGAHGKASSGDPARVAELLEPTAPVAARTLRKQALDAARSGDAAACEHALLAWARAERPAIANVGSLARALAVPAQREALEALQRARWQGGDAAAACAAVAQAFADGFVWRSEIDPARPDERLLPPLYPT